MFSYHPPEDLLKVIQKIAEAMVKDTSPDPTSIAQFNFLTMQDSLLYLFEMFNHLPIMPDDHPLTEAILVTFTMMHHR